MSRLANLSPAALRAMFSPDADDSLLQLLTITGTGIAAPIRLADGYTHKYEWLSATSMTVTDIEAGTSSAYTYLATDAVLKEAIAVDRENIFYGVMSGTTPFLFLPFELTLPSEDQASTTRCKLTLHDVMRQLMPVIRTINSAPSVDITLVLSKTPSVIEASFNDFLLGGIGYTEESVTGELTVESLATEPFPCHTFTPSVAPGLF